MRSQELMTIILFIYECVSIGELRLYYHIIGQDNSIAIDVPSDSTVADLESIIEQEVGIQSLTLTFQNTPLNKWSESLADSGITSEAVIDVNVALIMKFQEYHGIVSDGYACFSDNTKLPNIKQITVQINKDITQQIIHTFSQQQLSLFNVPYYWLLRQSNGQLDKLYTLPSTAVYHLQEAEITLVPIGHEYPPLNRSTHYNIVVYNTRHTDDNYCGDYGVYESRNDGYWTELVLTKRNYALDYIWISRPPDGYKFLLRKRHLPLQIQQMDESVEEEEEVTEEPIREEIDDVTHPNTTNNWKWILFFIIVFNLVLLIMAYKMKNPKDIMKDSDKQWMGNNV